VFDLSVRWRRGQVRWGVTCPHSLFSRIPRQLESRRLWLGLHKASLRASWSHIQLRARHTSPSLPHYDSRLGFQVENIPPTYTPKSCPGDVQAKSDSPPGRITTGYTCRQPQVQRLESTPLEPVSHISCGKYPSAHHGPVAVKTGVKGTVYGTRGSGQSAPQDAEINHHISQVSCLSCSSQHTLLSTV
jgi:hypothetical protein